MYPVREENLAFLEFSRHFRRHGLPVPEIYAEDLASGAYLEEDLGDTTLFDFLSAHRTGDTIAPEAVEAYPQSRRHPPALSGRGRHATSTTRSAIRAPASIASPSTGTSTTSSTTSCAWPAFLSTSRPSKHDFGRLTSFLLTARRDFFLYRDFQSRNIMLRDGQPFFLDYQGGRKGALQYDIASLLYDGKADLPPALRQQLLDHYLEALAAHLPITREAFMEHYYAYVYVRILQALGAYGFRGFYERKPHFLLSVPYALKNLRWLAHNVTLPIALPALLEALQAMLSSEKLLALASSAGNLTVRIFSFSFHRQLPSDESGNGGGFVFDGRALPIPAAKNASSSSPAKTRPSSTTSTSTLPCTSSSPTPSPWSKPAWPPTSSAASKT